MRLNVYSQELTRDTDIISTYVEDTGITYYGVRMYLASPDILHHTDDDDDRSAVTFWIPQAKSFGPSDLATVFRTLALLVEEAEARGVQTND